MARPDQHFQYGGQVSGNPAMAPQPVQGQPRLNGLGQVYGQGNWGPGSQWWANHNHQGGNPGGLLHALGPLGFGGPQMNGNPVMAGPRGFGPQGPTPGMGGGQMQGGPAGMPQPFGGQNPGGNMMPMGGMHQPGGMNQMQWQHILQMMQGQPGLNPLQRGFDGQMTQ